MLPVIGHQVRLHRHHTALSQHDAHLTTIVGTMIDHMLNLLPQWLVVWVAAQVSVGKWSLNRFIGLSCNEVHHFRLQTGPTYSKFSLMQLYLRKLIGALARPAREPQPLDTVNVTDRRLNSTVGRLHVLLIL